MAAAQTGRLAEDVKWLDIRHRTKHYAIAGTVSDARLVEYGRALEYIYREYATGFDELLRKSSHVESSQTADRFRVVIFATDAQYREFGARYFGRRSESTRGLYVPSAKLLLIRDETLTSQTYAILFHEAFHQFLDRHIPAAPTWVNEGLATYYGTARVTPGGLVFDRPRSVYFQIVRNGASAKQLLPFEELMTYSPGAFYDPQPVPGMSVNRSTLAYAESYSLVAYMLREPQGTDHLRTYLRKLASARSPAQAREVTLRVFPATLRQAMVSDWLSFVNRQ